MINIKLIESLSPNERKILPYLNDNINNICKKTGMDKISVLRALEFLQNKKILTLTQEKTRIVEIGVNGALYKKKGLPERRLLNLLNEKRILSLEEAQKQSSLSEDEFKASIGALKRKAMIDLKNGKIILNCKKEEISKKSLEELFLELLPIELNSLNPEQQYALKSLQARKNLIEIRDETNTRIEISQLGKEIMKHDLSKGDLIEAITPEILKKESLWKSKKFRRYDVTSQVPAINGGKRHFVNQAIDYGRRIWTDMGFKEMTGNMLVSSFWNFDALFTAQDHPVREMQDTFFINKKAELPDKKIVNAVRDSHEGKIKGSKGWNYKWNEEEAKALVLRTHTTCLSAQTLAKIKKEDLPQKFYAIGKCFRNETIDWSHLFEFNQTEGIVIDRDANFRHLIGYLKQFFSKMGYDKLRFRPSYFPYTEPSLEIDVYLEDRKKWLELGGAGIFRPEVSIVFFGEYIPVLAWGPGFDRIMMDYYNVKDMRILYKNDLNYLRKQKFWVK